MVPGPVIGVAGCHRPKIFRDELVLDAGVDRFRHAAEQLQASPEPEPEN